MQAETLKASFVELLLAGDSEAALVQAKAGETALACAGCAFCKLKLLDLATCEASWVQNDSNNDNCGLTEVPVEGYEELNLSRY